MFADFNKYACDFVSVDDFCYVNTDDVEKAIDVATVEDRLSRWHMLLGD